jgi:hypothetical protein
LSLLSTVLLTIHISGPTWTCFSAISCASSAATLSQPVVAGPVGRRQ